jgi:hypothetical protein
MQDFERLETKSAAANNPLDGMFEDRFCNFVRFLFEFRNSKET